MSNFALNRLQSVLVPGEDMIYLSKRHPITLAGPSLMAFIWVVVGAVGFRYLLDTKAAGDAYLALVMGIGLAGMTFGVAMIRYNTNLLLLTNRRMLTTSQYGFRQNEIPLWGVRDVQQNQPMLGLMFHYSTFMIAGGDGRTYRLSYVVQPVEFYRYLSAVAFPIMQGAGFGTADQIHAAATGESSGTPGPGASAPFVPPGGQW